MLYDLNVPWSASTSPADLERTLKFSASLGYNVVALNQTFAHPIPSQIVNAIPQLGPPSAHHPPPQAPQQKQQRQREERDEEPLDLSLSDDLPTMLRRATVIVADPATNHRLSALANAFDILAVRPTTEKAFLAACTTMTEPSIISLDLTQFFLFHFRPKPVMAAVGRGLRFEICYGQAVGTGPRGTPADPRARANFIANAASLVRATRGRGIIASSEAGSALSLRGPADIVNLLVVWGMSPDRATEALGVNPRGVVVNEGLRRRGFRGVVDLVQGAGELPPLPAAAPDADGAPGGRDTRKAQQQRVKRDAPNGMSKRAKRAKK